MNEDRLLRDLGHLMQEQETSQVRLDERWDRLAAGTLTAEEESELRALAGTSEEAREAYAAFRPLGADFQARMVERISAELGTQAPEAPETPEPRGRLLPFRPAVRWGGWVTTAAAAAATLFLVVRDPSYPPLPAYAAEIGPGVQENRGETEPAKGTPIFVPGSQLVLVVQPQQPQGVQGPLEAHAFREVPKGGGELSWEPVPGFRVTTGANGFMRLRGTLGEEIQLPLGTWRLCVAVSRPGKAPSEREISSALRTEQAASWQWTCASPLRVQKST